MLKRALVVIIAAAVGGGAAPGPQHGLHYTSPAERWDEALPLGNGTLGALVWGNGQPLRISLDRSDLWDLRPVPEFHSAEYSFQHLREWKEQGRMADIRRVYEDPYNRPAPTKLPAGRIEVTFPSVSVFRECALSIGRAEATVQFADGTTAHVFVHATEPVGMVRVNGPGSPVLKLIAPRFSGSVQDAAAGGIGAGDATQLGYTAPRQASGDGWQSYDQQGYGGFRFAVYTGWKRHGEGWEAAWSVASSFEGADPLKIARDRVSAALERGYSTLLSTHVAWWNAFWAKSSIALPNKVLEREWYLDQYKFGSAARQGAPPITLQAVWTADDGKLPPWKGDYHHDLNTELSYWPSYAGNHLEEETAYVQWLWRTRDAALAWTQQFYGLPGLNVPMTADLNGNQIGGWVQYTHSATTAAWLAHHFYLHWKYSGDRKFLETRAYPYLRDASVFIEAFTSHKDADGKRTHPLSASPEINDNRISAWFDTITNYDLALERWLLAATAELANEVGRHDDAARWTRVLSEMREFSTGVDGKLLIAAGHPLQESHRHFSHLMAIHPLGLIDWSDGPAAQKTIRASLNDLDRLGTSWWCGYSFAWLGSLAARARDGDKAEQALETFASAFVLRNSFHANGDQSGKGYSKFTYRPFTLEGNFAEAAGIQEMLLQSQRRRIQLFPAVPKKWRDASFQTLRAEGGFLVSAAKADGAVREVTVTAERGGKCRIVSPWTGEDIAMDLKPGERRKVTRPDGR
ncbi:MAG: glycoside hydrolase N-terminal domain-containing protein [Bryobacteraceae bacterium]